jgi:hypothetical protein
LAEEYENYQQLEAMARQVAERWDDEGAEGVALAEDMRALERRLLESVDQLLHKFEELHTRVWRLEDRLNQLAERMEQGG